MSDRHSTARGVGTTLGARGRTARSRTSVVLGAAAAVVLAGCTVPGDSEVAGAASASTISGTRLVAPVSPATTSAGDVATVVTPSAAPAAAQVTASETARARAEVGRLSTRRLAAQLVVPDLGSASAGARGIGAGYGGLVVMRSALPAGAGAATAAKKANQRYAAAMRSSGRRWPAFIAVDQEGGPVTRIDAPLTRFPAAMALGATDPALATQVGAASGSELRGLGFTVVMAPDADVTTANDPTIGVRSPGSDPNRVAKTALAYVQGFRAAGIVPVVKHFPGHGSVASDTHKGTAVQRASKTRLLARDLVPFRAAVRAGAPAIMTAHIVTPAIDPARPASLSPKVTTGLLRREMGFRGLVVTDALNMGAVTRGLAPGEATVRAIEAGADVALMPADPAAAVTALEKAVSTKRLSRGRLEESAVRMIVTLRSGRATVRPSAPGANRAVARRVAAASITQVAGRCGRRIVGRAVTVTGGTPADRAEFTRAMRARGVRIGGTGATRVVLLGGRAYRAGSGSASGSATGSGDVLVALDVPYGLAKGRARARLATYARTPATFDALADVLVGRAKAPGRLPVPVGAWKIGAGCG